MANLWNRLAFRLATLLTLALLPLGSVAIYAEFESWTAQREQATAALISRSLDAITGKRALLQSAMESARRLGPDMLARQDDIAACSAFLRDYTSSLGLFKFIGFIEASGQMRCVSAGEPVDFGSSAAFERALESPRANFSYQLQGAVTQQAVVLANHPVMEGDELRGFVSVSIGSAQIQLMSSGQQDEAAEKVVYLVNHLGDVLADTSPEDAPAFLPEQDRLQRLITQAANLELGRTVSGEDRVFSLATLIPGQLYVLGSWAPSNSEAFGRISFWRLAFPVLMWIASIAVVMLSVHYLVVRHLQHINRQLRSFALGNRGMMQRLPTDAPRELQDLDSTFTKMALLIQRDEVELEQSLREKTTLLMEVHHRVKNNFQLIASILNLQMRRVKDPAARYILLGVQARVRSLATIHRTLYEQKQVSLSDATEFFQSILQESLAIARTKEVEFEVQTVFEPVAITPEKIIPVSMIFAEALSNALTHLTEHAHDQPAELRIACLNRGDHAEISVLNSYRKSEDGAPSTGLGQDLMSAFALQINTALEIGPCQQDGADFWGVHLRIDLPKSDKLGAQPIAARKIQ